MSVEAPCSFDLLEDSMKALKFGNAPGCIAPVLFVVRPAPGPRKSHSSGIAMARDRDADCETKKRSIRVQITAQWRGRDVS